MKTIATTCLNEIQRSQIINLWNQEYPKIIAHKTKESFGKYLSVLNEQHHILLLDENELIKGWFFDFVREEERWFAMIVGSEMQGKGYGRKLLEMGKRNNSILNGWVVDSSDYIKADGTTYQSPIAFYRKMGFEVFPEIIFETEVMKTIKIKWQKIES